MAHVRLHYLEYDQTYTTLATLAGMNSSQLTKEQTAKLAEEIAKHQAYFYRLRRRLETLGFPQSDITLIMVGKIHELLTELKMHVHYLSCNGVGDSTRKR